MEDINNYISAIQQEIVAEEKTVKVARLIILLIKIEKELAAVKETLAKLQNHQQKYNQDSQLSAQIEQKIATVNRLSAKISKARLNLNYYFI
ncbi:chromosome segregation protein SMC [Pleurocapsa sp. CCALA 161]|uniref:chromosome segregation protein SMC n=1 Tax=Pleurocapsa sp. CCALA 161 TaxID=2107688 RepID=UPI000D06543A|nr:chromosome segregation protein SMC [Pleurocapsa sp. CCALA 161]PSB10051.1 chromosome segregation protein SMC [Pleurocapsa sp. CCALA 161]